MASATQIKYDASTDFTITLASLANSAAGVGRQSDMISNTSNRPGALVFVGLKSSGSAPTAGALYSVYLIRRDSHASPTVTDDNAGGSDAAWTRENAPLLGTITVTATTNKVFTGVFDTAPLGPLGPSWGIGIVNASGQALNATEADHLTKYTYYYAEAQ